MFEVAYETTFCATHVLHRDGQPIEPQHGHDWRVEVVAEARRSTAWASSSTSST